MIKETFFTFTAKIYLGIIGFLIAIVTARTLGPVGRGIFSFLDNLIAISILFGNFGLGLANVYFLGKKKYSTQVIFWNSLFFGLFLGVTTSIIILAIESIFPSAFQNIPIKFIWLISLALPLFIATNIIWYILLGLGRIFTYNLTQIIVRTSFFFLLTISLLISPLIKMSVIILAFSSVIWFISLVPFFRKYIHFLKPTISLSVLKDSIRFGFISQLGTVFQFFIPRIGIFLINLLLYPAMVGFYSIALVVSETLNYSSYSLSTVLLPKTSGAEIQDSDPERLVQKSCRLNLFFVSLVGIIIIIFSPIIIKILFGIEFLESVNALRVLILGSIFGSCAWVLGSYILGRGFPRYFMTIFLVSFSAVVILNLIFVPIFGILGSAIAVLISNFISSSLAFIFIKKINLMPFSLKNFLIPTIEDFKNLKFFFFNTFKNNKKY